MEDAVHAGLLFVDEEQAYAEFVIAHVGTRRLKARISAIRGRWARFIGRRFDEMDRGLDYVM